MKKQIIESTWGDFSRKFIKAQSLPYGTELRLSDLQGKKKRNDIKIKRQKILKKTTEQIKDSENVKYLITIANGMLSSDITARKLKIELVSPERKVLNGNTSVGTVRNMQPRQTEEDKERLENEEEIISEMQANFTMWLSEAEYLVEDPSTTLCKAIINGAVERYGRAAVIEALGK